MASDFMIPDGTYRARAAEAKLCETSTGKEQVAVQFELLEDELGGVRVTWFGFFTEKTEKRTLEALFYCGWDGNNLEELNGVGKNEVEIVIETETYEGKRRNRVRWVNKIGGGGLGFVKPLEPSRAKNFSERMRGAILAAKREMEADGAFDAPKATAKKSNGNEPNALGFPDDEIPF